MKSFIRTGVLFLAWATADRGFAQGYIPVVVPNDSVASEGNSYLPSPFGGRQQYLFDASEFSSLTPFGGGWIEGIVFRLDVNPTGAREYGANVTGLQISASTTLQTESSLSPVFSLNYGTDPTLVFSGNVNVDAGPLGGASPQSFTTYFVAFTPRTFWYDPARGNLLLDFNGPVGQYSGTGFLDAWDRTGDGVASVRGAYGSSSGVVSTRGLVALIGFDVVPEPSSVVLMVLGLAGLLWLSKARRKV